MHARTTTTGKPANWLSRTRLKNRRRCCCRRRRRRRRAIQVAAAEAVVSAGRRSDINEATRTSKRLELFAR